MYDYDSVFLSEDYISSRLGVIYYLIGLQIIASFLGYSA